MTKEQIKYMADRFLAWQLPNDFNPDAGISYTRPNLPTGHPGPSGTNLLDATQATALVQYMAEGLPVSPAVESGWVIERGDSEVSKPLYWDGTAPGDVAAAWTHDHNDAMRFANDTSALVVSMNMMGRGATRIRCRIAEYQWG